jgi:hypothetical protein
MQLTEAEAKEKFCPKSLHLETPFYCEGSKCMAWLWNETGFNARTEEILYEKGRCGLVNITLNASGRVR